MACSEDLARPPWRPVLKGAAEIAWEEPPAREAFLAEIGFDAGRLLAAGRDAQAAYAADSPGRDRILSLHEPESQFITAIADAAYGDGYARQKFADSGRTLIAKVPK